MKKTAKLLGLAFLLLFPVLLAACSVSGASSSSDTDSSWQDVQSAGKLVIGLEDGFLPVSDFDADGARGFAAESALELCRRLGVEAEFVETAPEDALTMLADGEIDCVWAGSKTVLLDDSSDELSYTYFQGDQVILCPASAEIRNIADLQGLAVGVKTGSSGQKELEASTAFRDSLSAVTEYPDTQSLKAALDAGEISAAVMEDLSAALCCRESPDVYAILPDDTGTAPMALAHDDYCTIFRSGDASLAAQVESALGGMIADGTLTVYSEKWFGSDRLTAQ